MNPEPSAVVVGVDASETALRAAHLAAEEAVRRSVRLHIVHAITFFDGMTYPYPGLDVPGLMNAGAESVLQAVADAVVPTIPGDRITTTAMTGDPVEVLVAASTDASVVVMGGRGVGGVAGLLLGSTAHGVVARAECPVVVLPADAGVQTQNRQSVVVGVEGRGDDDVLAFAFDAAAGRGTDLVAVHAWQDVDLETAFRSISPLVDWAGVMADEERVLAEALAGWLAGWTRNPRSRCARSSSGRRPPAPWWRRA
jgi:nucleotide-binding universal stress UspA family protein